MINEREYTFASSFLKASDGKDTPRGRLARFSEAGTKEALRAAVADAYSLADAGDGVYDAAICDACEKLRSCLPDFSVMYPLLFRYDCTNVKTAIKCTLKNIASFREMMFECGTVPAETVINSVEKNDFSPLPANMAKAAEKALAAYKKTGEVRVIDLELDAACYADMSEAASAGGVELIQNIVKLRADGVNILAAMRIKRSNMPQEAALSLLERAFVPGGDVPMSALISAETGCADMPTVISRLPMGCVSASAVRKAADESSLAMAERAFDEAALKLCDKYRFKPFGAEVAVRFLVLREAEMTNCRIIEASMKGNSSIREGLRRAYV